MTDNRPRVRAAGVFAVAAGALAMLWFLPSVWARGDVYGGILFILAPTLAGGLAGWLMGGPLCAPPPGYGPGHAVMTGAAVASLSLFLLAPLFAVIFLVGPEGSFEVLARGVSVALLLLVALGPVILLAGASLGLFLHRYSSRRPSPGSTHEGGEGADD